MASLFRHRPELLAYGLAVVVVVAVGWPVLLWLGVAPSVAVRGFLSGAVTSRAGLADTLNMAVPIALTGLAVAIPFRVRLLNIGGEGQLLTGALAATWAALALPPMPAVVAVPAVLLIGGAGGLAWALIPALGKARLQINEIVTTIMFNFLAMFLFSWAINHPLREQGGAFPQTDRIPDHVVLANFSTGFRAHYGLVLAAIVVLGSAYFLRHTSMGYRLTVAGVGDELAAGFSVSRARVQIVGLLTGGFLAGLAGAVQVMGVQRRLIEGFNPGFGFDGIVAAFLVQGHPLGTSAAALALGALRSGGQRLHIVAQLPISSVVLFQALLIIVALVARRLVRQRRPAAPVSRQAASAGAS